MRLDEVLAAVGHPEALDVLAPYWEESVAALGDGIPCFLRAEQCLVNREWCGLAPETDTLLLQAARRIVDDQPLRLLAWHCQRLLYDHPDYENLARWPSLEGAMGELSGVFYLLVTMAMVPRIKSIHESMSVPEQVTRDTCSQISCVTGNYRRMTSGRLGVTLNTLHWLRIYAAGRLFRIGRMEYMLGPFPGGPSVYQHHETGETIALAPDGVRYDEEGYLVTVDDRAIEGRCWTATLASEGGLIVGHPVSPYGMALRQQVALWGSEWECVLKPGDPVLDMHIPAGGGMTLDKCKDSMRQAVCFFRKHFPDRRFRAIASVSWIFGTQLEHLAFSSDNLVRFQHELHLYPVPTSRSDGLWFIFLREIADPQQAPRDTSLQRAVADYLAAGHKWRAGGMFFLTDHLDRFGTQYYRSAWPPRCMKALGTGEGGPSAGA